MKLRAAILGCAFVVLAGATQPVLGAGSQELGDPPEIEVQQPSAAPTATEAPRSVKAKPRPKRRRGKRRRLRRELNVPPLPTPGPTGEDAPAAEEAAPEAEQAEPIEEAPAPPVKKAQFEVHGFVTSRFLAVSEDTSALLYGLFPILPSPRAYAELNIQPHLRVLGQRFGLAADLSLYLSTVDPKHLFLMNELYAESRAVGPLYLLAGRRRVIWGSGLGANPTDLINPPKNPLDFEQQRTGAFLLPLIEIVTKYVTVSGLVSPAITTNEWAIPNSMDFGQLKVAGRVYFLLFNTDVNLVYNYDHGKRKHYGGLSFSRFIGDKFEVHAETLIGQGPGEIPPVPVVPVCGAPPTSPFDKVVASLVAGGRVDFSDQTFIAAEYFFNGNGFDGKGFDLFKSQVPCTKAALAGAPPMLPNPIGHPIDPFFFPLRQHYMFLLFQRPHLTNDRLEALSLGASAIISLVEPAVLLQVRAGYKFADAVSLGVTGAARLGTAGSEYGISPNRLTGFIDLRVTY